MIELPRIEAPREQRLAELGRDLLSAAYLQGVYGKTAAGGVAVLINSAGKLGTASAATAQSLSAAAGRHLLAEVRRQQREIKRLRELVRGGR